MHALGHMHGVHRRTHTTGAQTDKHAGGIETMLMMVHARVHACTQAIARVRWRARTRTHTHRHAHMHMHACTHAHARAHTHIHKHMRAQVLSKALEVWGLSAVPLASPECEAARKEPQLESAFLCNLQEHWFTIRRVYGEVRETVLLLLLLLPSPPFSLIREDRHLPWLNSAQLHLRSEPCTAAACTSCCQAPLLRECLATHNTNRCNAPPPHTHTQTRTHADNTAPLAPAVLEL
jgi:hypothetical protein